MYVNKGREINIFPLMPQGTNSTMFTECCYTAICDDQQNCPMCGRAVIGSDAPNNDERGRIRWRNATRNWR